MLCVQSHRRPLTARACDYNLSSLARCVCELVTLQADTHSGQEADHCPDEQYLRWTEAWTSALLGRSQLFIFILQKTIVSRGFPARNNITHWSLRKLVSSSLCSMQEHCSQNNANPGKKSCFCPKVRFQKCDHLCFLQLYA